MPSRIQIAKPDIVRYFNSLGKRIFDRAELNTIVETHRAHWRLAKSMTVGQFVEFLVKNAQLKVARFDFPSRPILKYTWGEVPVYSIALSLRPNCYLTHYTAMYFHGLTDQVPKTINVNAEQGPKRGRPSGLDQGRIDAAFKKPTRVSQNIAEHREYRIRLLNGQHTGNIGVVEISGPEGEPVRLTDLERTLIDIAVRPEYAGGVFQVLEAYKRAGNKVSVNRLAALLKSIAFIYPYHQAIGFYLERARSYDRSQIGLLRKFEIRHDFYLMHQIKDAEYSRQWRLFYPKGFG